MGVGGNFVHEKRIRKQRMFWILARKVFENFNKWIVLSFCQEALRIREARKVNLSSVEGVMKQKKSVSFWREILLKNDGICWAVAEIRLEQEKKGKGKPSPPWVDKWNKEGCFILARNIARKRRIVLFESESGEIREERE